MMCISIFHSSSFVYLPILKKKYLLNINHVQILYSRNYTQGETLRPCFLSGYVYHRNICSYKHLHMSVYESFICNIQKYNPNFYH